MNLKEPRAKKKCKLQRPLPLPLIQLNGDEICKFDGHFNGFSVIVENVEHLRKINSMGFFGKGNLSKSYPNFNQPRDAQIIRKRQLNRRKRWAKELVSTTKMNKKVVVVPDSDSEDGNDYFTNLLPEYHIDTSNLVETLNLSLEEAFFLCHAIQCLNVYVNNKIMEKKQLWELFTETDASFIQNYIVYYYFRTKNWVVKPGFKFGGDFLLYKEGPPFYHASYVVIIEVVDSDTLQRCDEMCRRCMKTTNIIGLNRLCQTTGKELLLCQILWPKELKAVEVDDLPQFSVNEVLIRRWVPSQEKESNKNS